MGQSKEVTLKIFLAAAVSLGLGQHAYGQVFKCFENGRNVYSDKPCKGDSAPMQKGSVSVMPSQGGGSYSPSAFPQSNYPTTTSPVNRSGGKAFARSPSTPEGRKTISTLLPNGGSIADRKKQSSQRKAPPAPPPSVMTHCAGGFCYDTQGETHHNIGGGLTVNTQGKVCQTVGNIVQCN